MLSKIKRVGLGSRLVRKVRAQARFQLDFDRLEERRVMSGIVVSPPVSNISMVSATTVDSMSVTYTYQVQNAADPGPLEIGVYRAPTPQFNPAQDLLIGTQNLTPSELTVGTHTIQDPIAGGITIDPAAKYVLVVADPSAQPVPSNDVAEFRTYVVGAVTHGLELSLETPEWVYQMADALVTQDHYDAAIPFDWSLYSSLPVQGATQLAGALMAAKIATTIENLSPPPGPNDVVDLQLIGHSRGGVVISQAGLDLQILENNGFLPQLKAGFLEMTFLDPHPANNNTPTNWYSASPGLLGQAVTSIYTFVQGRMQDPQAVVPTNANQVEVFYQHTSYRNAATPQERIFNIWGQIPVVGRPTGSPVEYYDVTNLPGGAGHGEVPTWYLTNIIPTLGGSHTAVTNGSAAPNINLTGTTNPSIPTASQPTSTEPIGGINPRLELRAAYEAIYPTYVYRPRVAIALLRQAERITVSFEHGRDRVAIVETARLGRFIDAQSGRTISPVIGESIGGFGGVVSNPNFARALEGSLPPGTPSVPSILANVERQDKQQ
jgi:hypothetical protein